MIKELHITSPVLPKMLFILDDFFLCIQLAGRIKQT